MEKTIKEVKIWMGTTKGELMKICYDNDAKKLANVDSALPLEYLKQNPRILSYWYVMDYNTLSVFGEVRNLKDVAAENGIKLIYP
jgi:hypothetical protein